MSASEKAIPNGQSGYTKPEIASYLAMTCFLLIFLLSAQTLFAQITYTDRVYRPNIKTVEFYNTAKEGSFPVITLNSSEQLLLTFDELTDRTGNYNYTIEHCDADWNPSRISPTDYLQSFTEDRLMDYRYSTNTLTKYVHYELTLPNQTIAPKISGNYLLKVYENGNPNQPVLSRRFYVVNQQASIQAQVVPSNAVANRETNQKLNFQIDFAGLVIRNPYTDIRVLVMQNGRSETGQMNTRPTFIRGASLLYNDVTINDFAGGNEFRHFDTRSLRLNSERVQRIFRDTANAVLLLTDHARDTENYLLQYDNNGSFYIRNQEGRDPRYDADYAQVYFNLAVPGSTNNAVYVVGRFNNFTADEQSKMQFDATRGSYYYNTLLKQGVYDYAYATIDQNGKLDLAPLEGNHFETENDYQVLVYFRPPGARWEELVGYKQLNPLKR